MIAAETRVHDFRQVIAEVYDEPVAGMNVCPAETAIDPTGRWLRVAPAGAAVPPQGWKLHVSASVFGAEETLRRVLPVLFAEGVVFKTTASYDKLGVLNSGLGGLSQIGKFITIYPRDDEQAVRLALALDNVTRGLTGPAVPSDRPLRPGSVVHYRYGGFGGLTVQSRNGEIAPAIRAPDGELVPDLRHSTYRPPVWAVDPFEAAGLAEALPDSPPLIAGRYLLLGAIHRSARGGVFMAVDLDAPARRVLKRAPARAQAGLAGFDASDRLRHEWDVLRSLAADTRFPSVFDLIEHDDDLYLIMEDVDGATLEQHCVELTRVGKTIPNRQLAAWGRELAAMLGVIHETGLVYRDLKSTNVIVAPDGHLRLIDLELTCPRGASTAPGSGTRGYISPQQASGEPAAVTDDIYGLGALLFFMASGAEPSQSPRPLALLDRPLELLNPTVNPRLSGVIARCLDPDPHVRFPTMDALAAALAEIQSDPVITSPAYGAETTEHGENDADAEKLAANLARRLGDTLTALATAAPDGPGRTWVSHHPLTAGMRARDINTGAAGTALALAEIVDEFGDPAHREALAGTLTWLEQSKRPGGAPLPGLYVGEAGIGAALLRGGQVLHEPALIAAAEERGRMIASMPFESPDLFNGTAGRLLFHLLLWDETGGSEHLGNAVAAGDALLAAAEETADRGACWAIPDGYGGLSGKRYLGYAHGAAGIADALLDLFDATGDERFAVTARGAGIWLSHLALPVLDDGNGLNWPSVEGDASAAAFWCHGAAGIGRFWLHAAALDLLPEAAEIARCALLATARASRWAGPALCHGLAGSIELLLDAYQIDGDAAHRREAHALSRLLEAFALEERGLLVWPSESPAVITPDYMVGYAGVATTLLRLADPETRPRGLSRSGFRFRA